jgi:hypothetical protein
MSALFFQVQPDQALVATDTLALDEMSRTPCQFTEKAFAVPHMRSIVTGTGVMQVVQRYYANLLNGVVADDVDELNNTAPDVLRQIERNVSPPEDISTTIYHLGLSESEGRYVAYDLHSGYDFEPQRIEHEVAFKPADPEAAEGVDPDSPFPERAVQVIENLKEIDDARPDEERIGIGGEVQLRAMAGSPAETIIQTLHRFDDYEAQKQSIL